MVAGTQVDNLSLTLSVCIPTYNRPKQVASLLANLAEQAAPPDQVVIVDASPNEQTRSVADSYAKKYPSLRYERYTKGLTRQRNRAIELATGDILVFLDDDVLLEDHFLQESRRIFVEDSAGTIVGVTGVQPDLSPSVPGWGWRLKRRVGIIETDQPGRLLACGETTPLPVPERGQLVPVDYLPGGITAWRRSIFTTHRYSEFFESYGLGEDKYFSGCVSRRYRLCVSGDLVAHHYHVAGNRPAAFRWGYANVVNHCFIMRECSRGRHKTLRFFLFHGIDVVNELISWPFRERAVRRLAYGLGRTAGILRCLFAPPRMGVDDPARRNREALCNPA